MPLRVLGEPLVTTVVMNVPPSGWAVSVTLVPLTSADGDRLREGLSVLQMDQLVRFRVNDETGTAIIWGRSEKDLETAIDRLKRVFHVSARVGLVQRGKGDLSR